MLKFNFKNKIFHITIIHISICKVLFLFLFISLFFQCNIIDGNSESASKETETALSQAVVLNSLNQSPNCGSVKGKIEKNGTFNSTLLSNTASDIIQINLAENDEITIKATPRNWDIRLERINPSNCEILDTQDALSGSAIEEITLKPITGIQNTIRIKSADLTGSGDYSLEAF